MINKNHLSKKEFNIYKSIEERIKIFTTKDIHEMYSKISKEKINRALKNLVDKEYLLRINKGEYLVFKEYTLQEIEKIAIDYNYGYLAYSTALHYYGLIDYIPETIFIATKNKSKEITINQTTIKYIKIKDFTNFIKKEEILISTIEKTIFDCFDKVEYAGGYSLLSKAIYEIQEDIDWDKFIKLYENIKSKRKKQITGYILEIIKEKTDIKIPLKVITFFKTQEKAKTYFINTKNKKSKYVSDWKIKDNYGKENVVSWWN